jgi:putative addiction module component (TIGR02574 family)
MMTLGRDQILEHALALPPDDRAFVADVLEQSLLKSGFATPEIEAAWVAEIQRRIEAYERGEMTAIPGDEAMDNIRKALAERRASRATP